MGQCFSPRGLCGVQANALSCEEGQLGTVLTGDNDAIVSCGFIDINVEPIIEAGQNRTTRNGAGAICAKDVSLDQVTGWDVTATMCDRIDTDLMTMTGLFDPVRFNNGDVSGIKPKCGEGTPCDCDTADSCTGAISLLLWFKNTGPTGQSTVLPYTVLAIPKIRFTISGLSFGQEYTNYTLTGTAESNGNWGSGPGGIYPTINGDLDCEWAKWTTATPPPGGCKCGEVCGFDTAPLSLGYTGAAGGEAPKTTSPTTTKKAEEPAAA